MHDAAYKLLFSHRRMVADLLHEFLPGGASPGFDFDTLEPLPASHVGRALERREGDLMWRLRARSAPDDGWVYVLVLLEFQSGIDRRMALRDELVRMAAAGEVESMGSLAVERWKELERRKEAQILARGMAQGRTEGLEFERRLLGSQAARRFGADTGQRLSALLADVSEPERMAAMGDAIIDCGTGAELLAAARRIVGAAN